MGQEKTAIGSQSLQDNGLEGELREVSKMPMAHGASREPTP
jgi:hypothetical protein